MFNFYIVKRVYDISNKFKNHSKGKATYNDNNKIESILFDKISLQFDT